MPGRGPGTGVLLERIAGGRPDHRLGLIDGAIAAEAHGLHLLAGSATATSAFNKAPTQNPLGTLVGRRSGRAVHGRLPVKPALHDPHRRHFRICRSQKEIWMMAERDHFSGFVSERALRARRESRADLLDRRGERPIAKRYGRRPPRAPGLGIRFDCQIGGAFSSASSNVLDCRRLMGNMGSWGLGNLGQRAIELEWPGSRSQGAGRRRRRLSCSLTSPALDGSTRTGAGATDGQRPAALDLSQAFRVGHRAETGHVQPG